MIKNFLRILVCPLDWGIGHATRCVPVIRLLRQNNHHVIFAGDGKPLAFLREYFPDLEFIRFPGAKVSYPAGKNMTGKMVLQTPSLIYNLVREHKKLGRILVDHRIDAVISDNRFGLWSEKIYSVYLTHQVMIKAPSGLKWAEPLLYRMHKWIIGHYDECWIPDLPGDVNLSGDLSHKYPVPANGSFTGLLSRFEQPVEGIAKGLNENTPELLVMLSGPEPQRSILEKLVLDQWRESSGITAVVLRGLPGSSEELESYPGLKILNHVSDEEITCLVRSAKVILCRPGYSTLMDLAVLGKSAVLVPTPGQTEQEYLAAHLAARGAFRSVSQENFSLRQVLAGFQQTLPARGPANDPSLLRSVIGRLQERINMKQKL